MTCPRCGREIAEGSFYATVEYGEKELIVHDRPACVSTEDRIVRMGEVSGGEAP